MKCRFGGCAKIGCLYAHFSSLIDLVCGDGFVLTFDLSSFNRNIRYSSIHAAVSEQLNQFRLLIPFISVDERYLESRYWP